MNKNLVLAVSVAAAFMLTSCASVGNGETASESGSSDASLAPDGLLKPGSFSACIDPEYPPLEYYEDGSGGDIIGFDADAFRAVANHWGVDYSFEVTSFDGLMPGLQAGKCDVIFGTLYQSEERAEVADSVTLMQTGPSVLATPEAAEGISHKLDLCGLRGTGQAASVNVAAIHTLSEECVAAGLEPVNVTEYPATAGTVLAVLNGKSDFLVETDVAVSYMEEQNSGRLVAVRSVFEPDTSFGVFAVKDSPLIDPITDALSSLNDGGSLTKLAEQYNLDPAVLGSR